MNKSFWDEMVKAWCKVAATIDTEIIDKIVEAHSKSDVKSQSGYSLNPLDDEDDEDDEEDDWVV